MSVDIPAQPAPYVEVHLPEQAPVVHVNVPEPKPPRPRSIRVEFDDRGRKVYRQLDD